MNELDPTAPPLRVRLDPSDKIPGLATTIGTFWSWAYSDVLSNRNRSVFAEFIVASALDVAAEPRIEWDAVDLRYRGVTVEVKSAAYLQSWAQRRQSQIRFDIAPKLGWDASTNTSAKTPRRSADLYVFCLYPEQDRGECNVLHVPSWEFRVVASLELNEKLGDQESLSLGPLNDLAEPIPYSQLRLAVDRTIDSGRFRPT